MSFAKFLKTSFLYRTLPVSASIIYLSSFYGCILAEEYRVLYNILCLLVQMIEFHAANYIELDNKQIHLIISFLF